MAPPMPEWWPAVALPIICAASLVFALVSSAIARRLTRKRRQEEQDRLNIPHKTIKKLRAIISLMEAQRRAETARKHCLDLVDRTGKTTEQIVAEAEATYQWITRR